MPGRPILIVDDDLLWVRLLQRAFDEGGIGNPTYAVTDGEEALAFIRNEAPYGDEAPRPGLIVLDLNLPRMDGIAFLEASRRDRERNHIPTVIMSSSNEPADRRRTEAAGATAYIVKPLDADSLVDAVRDLETYCSPAEET